MIEDFQIPALSLPEQRAIARILSSLDDKIELNRRTNATLEELARGLFRSWFVDFAPVRAKAEGRAPTGMDAATAALFPDGFETVDGREVPRGWKIGVLDDIAFNKRDAIQPEEMPSDMPYIGLEHMPRRSIALSEWETASDLMSNKFRFQMGDILFGKLRPYFHKVGFSVIEGVCSTDILVLLPKEKIWYSYVLMCVSSDDLIIFATAASDGTKMPRTSWRDISRYNVVIPSNSIINMFNSKILSITEKIRSNIHESRTLAALRDALLPKLLSGELRVREVERVEA